MTTITNPTTEMQQAGVAELRRHLNTEPPMGIFTTVASIWRAMENARQGNTAELPERVIDQLVAQTGFSYVEPSEQDLYDLAQAIRREVLARLPANAADTVMVAIKPSMQLLCDIVECGLNGGIAYWTRVIQYAENTDQFPTLVLREQDNDKHPLHTVTAADLVRGIQLVLENMDPETNAHTSTYSALVNNDGSYIDADAADCIFQYGLLGKVVYS